jgi:hypothetical protein
MTISEQIFKFLGEVIAYGGGGAVIAYLLFQYLGKTWIENKFVQHLEQLRHQQAMELQKLRVEIESMLSGAIKLQEKEFQVLPDAWQKLDESHGLVAWLVSPLQEYAAVAKMTPTQLDEFLESCEFTESQKNDIRQSPNKNAAYQEITFWHRLHRTKKAFRDLQSFVARNGIFLRPELKEKFSEISKMLWSAVVSKEVGHEGQDWNMQIEGWKKVEKEAEPLYKSIEADIQARLQSHGRKP